MFIALSSAVRCLSGVVWFYAMFFWCLSGVVWCFVIYLYVVVRYCPILQSVLSGVCLDFSSVVQFFSDVVRCLTDAISEDIKYRRIVSNGITFITIRRFLLEQRY